METLTHRRTLLGPFFRNSGHFFLFSKKDKGGLPPSPLLVARLCGISKTVWYFLQFVTKNNFLGLLAWVGIETQLPLKCRITTFFKSLFSSFTEVFMSCATLKRDVLSANNFVLEDKSPDKSGIFRDILLS